LDPDTAVKLLLVEDDERVASFIMKGLKAHGYAIEWVATGKEAIVLGTDPDLSLVILDLGLPDIDGLEVLDGLRDRGVTVPVMVLTARREVEHRVHALNLGADDYLPKPFAFDELLARLQARLRPSASQPPGVLRAAGLQMDLVSREVTVNGRKVDLSAREFSLLQSFVSHPRHVLSRQQLMSTAWGVDFDMQSNLVDVYVGYLRRKLGDRIETVRGVGYRLRTDGSASPTIAPDAVEREVEQAEAVITEAAPSHDRGYSKL
jgi:DNA-binding response OmpR family regulator